MTPDRMKKLVQEIWNDCMKEWLKENGDKICKCNQESSSRIMDILKGIETQTGNGNDSDFDDF